MFRKLGALALLSSFLLCVGSDADPEGWDRYRYFPPGPESKEGNLVLEKIKPIKVYKMQYCERFDCDDFAWAFDSICRDLKIRCLELTVSGVKDFLVMGHVLNIVVVPSKKYKNESVWAIVEPQYNEVVVAWRQKRGTAPNVFQLQRRWLMNKLVAFYKKRKQYQITRLDGISRGGHLDRERPFTDYSDLFQEFVRITGRDPDLRWGIPAEVYKKQIKYLKTRDKLYLYTWIAQTMRRIKRLEAAIKELKDNGEQTGLGWLLVSIVEEEEKALKEAKAHLAELKTYE